MLNEEKYVKRKGYVVDKTNSFTTLNFNVCVYVYTCSRVYGITYVYVDACAHEHIKVRNCCQVSFCITFQFYYGKFYFLNQVIRVHSYKHLKTSSKTF